MTYTSLATPVPNTKILVSTFGGLVKQDLDDHEGRILTSEARLTTLETPYRGDATFYLAGAVGANLMATSAAANLITGWVPLPPAVSFPGLITHSAGVFTIAKTGYWGFTLNLRWNAVSTDLYAMIGGASSSELWGKNSCAGGSRNLNVSITPRRYVLGQTLRTYAYSGIAANLTREGTNDQIPSFVASYHGT